MKKLSPYCIICLLLFTSIVSVLSGCSSEQLQYSEEQQTAVEKYGVPDYFELLLDHEDNSRLESWLYVSSLEAKIAWINGEMEDSLSQKIDARELVAVTGKPALFPGQEDTPVIANIPQPNPPEGIEPGQFGFDTTRDSLISRFGEPDMDAQPESYEGTSVEWLLFAKAGVLATIFNGNVVGIMTIDPAPDWQGAPLENTARTAPMPESRGAATPAVENEPIEPVAENEPIDYGPPVEVTVEDSSR